MLDINVLSVSNTRLGRCLPQLPENLSLETCCIVALYYEMFYGGCKSYGIPSVRKLSRMSPRRRKKLHVDGKNTTLGFDLTIEFARELTVQDAPIDWWEFGRDLRPCSYSEHEKSVGNWFMPEIEAHGLFTVMGLPLKDPMKVMFSVSADHDRPEPFYEGIERLLAFLLAVDKKDFVKTWEAKWYSLNHWNDALDSAYQFAIIQKGDLSTMNIPLDKDGE